MEGPPGRPLHRVWGHDTGSDHPPTMPDTPAPSDPADAPSEPPARAPRRLPVGPAGLLVITAVALVVAFGVVWALFGRTSNDSVKVTDAIQNVETAPVVPAGTATVAKGDPAPAVNLNYLDGGSETLADLKGAPVVLNFWSSTSRAVPPGDAGLRKGPPRGR